MLKDALTYSTAVWRVVLADNTKRWMMARAAKFARNNWEESLLSEEEVIALRESRKNYQAMRLREVLNGK